MRDGKVKPLSLTIPIKVQYERWKRGWALMNETCVSLYHYKLKNITKWTETTQKSCYLKIRHSFVLATHSNRKQSPNSHFDLISDPITFSLAVQDEGSQLMSSQRARSPSRVSPCPFQDRCFRQIHNIRGFSLCSQFCLCLSIFSSRFPVIDRCLLALMQFIPVCW